MKGVHSGISPTPNTGVESCAGGSLYDSRVYHKAPGFGPFETIREFHLWLRRGLVKEDFRDRQTENWNDAQEMMDRQDGPWPPPVYTHGDLKPSNIFVRDGQVVGVIDWEFAGWSSNYWEYTSAWFGNTTRTEWQTQLVKFIDPPCPEDLRMEEIRHKWYGE